MKVVIGGSSSTGSSLLNQCLGRHRDVVISAETSLYARPQLLTKWETNKARILNWSKLKPLRSHGWHRENGVAIPHNSWSVTNEDIDRLVRQAVDFDTFITSLEQSILMPNAGSVWVEKTPANALMIPAWSEVLRNTHFIIMVRHPLEAIASMIHRGYDTLYACGIFLLNTSFGLTTDSDNCIVVPYEEFLGSYKAITEDIALSVGLDPALFDWVTSTGDTKMDSWRYAEDELPQPVVHDRFQSLPSQLQREVLDLVECLRIKESFQIAGMVAKYLDITSLAQATGYELTPVGGKVQIASYKTKLRNSLLKRTALKDPVNIFNTPFEIVLP